MLACIDMHRCSWCQTHDANNSHAWMYCIHSSVFRLPVLLNRDSVTLPLKVAQSCTCCPSVTGMDELATAGFTAHCFPRLGAGLGAGLGTVGATLMNDHFWRYHNALVSSINDPLPQAQLHCVVPGPFPRCLATPPPPPVSTVSKSPHWWPKIAVLCNMTLMRSDLEPASAPPPPPPSPPRGGWAKGGGALKTSPAKQVIDSP